jgi:hypothetical protein
VCVCPLWQLQVEWLCLLTALLLLVLPGHGCCGWVACHQDSRSGTEPPRLCCCRCCCRFVTAGAAVEAVGQRALTSKTQIEVIARCFNWLVWLLAALNMLQEKEVRVFCVHAPPFPTRQLALTWRRPGFVPTHGATPQNLSSRATGGWLSVCLSCFFLPTNCQYHLPPCLRLSLPPC